MNADEYRKMYQTGDFRITFKTHEKDPTYMEVTKEMAEKGNGMAMALLAYFINTKLVHSEEKIADLLQKSRDLDCAEGYVCCFAAAKQN